MDKIKFSKDVLEERLDYAHAWYNCCKENLQKYLGTKQGKRWAKFLLESMSRIFRLEDLLGNPFYESKKLIFNNKKEVLV